MSRRRSDHIKEYMRSLSVWREKNLSNKNCHDRNICCLIRSMYELNLMPKFWKEVARGEAGVMPASPRLTSSA